jgi:hypothetical protein
MEVSGQLRAAEEGRRKQNNQIKILGFKMTMGKGEVVPGLK